MAAFEPDGNDIHRVVAFADGADKTGSGMVATPG